MICVPATLQKHGGFFFPSVTGCCTKCLPGCADPSILHSPGRAAQSTCVGRSEPRRWDCLCPRRGRGRVTPAARPRRDAALRTCVLPLSYEHHFVEAKLPIRLFPQAALCDAEVLRRTQGVNLLCIVLPACQSLAVFSPHRDSGYAQFHIPPQLNFPYKSPLYSPSVLLKMRNYVLASLTHVNFIINWVWKRINKSQCMFPGKEF